MDTTRFSSGTLGHVIVVRSGTFKSPHPGLLTCMPLKLSPLQKEKVGDCFSYALLWNGTRTTTGLLIEEEEEDEYDIDYIGILPWINNETHLDSVLWFNETFEYKVSDSLHRNWNGIANTLIVMMIERQ
jgi:hypothetical protein